jgi:long-subunit fatty acid transport protein
MQPRKTKGALRLTTFFHRLQLVVPKLLMLGACGLLSVLVPVHSWAGGLYITEFGTPSNGVANAGAVALANDASTAWHNPAGMTHVSGNQIMGHAWRLHFSRTKSSSLKI